MRYASFLAVLLVVAALPVATRAAESYDNCTGTIAALPATISTQGVWCLKQDLGTAMTSGAAITIATNNVTIDCNDFKLGGLAAGDGSQTRGIQALNRHNITVRHCNVRGFLIGIDLGGDAGGGHLVEDNRLDHNLRGGILVRGSHNRVLRNAIHATGGSPDSIATWGIRATGDIIDNLVADVFATGANGQAEGIEFSGDGSQVRDNHVRGLDPNGTGQAFGIHGLGEGVAIDGNRVAQEVATTGTGISGGPDNVFCTYNTVLHYSTPLALCDAALGNLTLP
ncbi:MAG TPA: hypothetical protein VGD21_06740 [Lysobacter sp.]